MAHIELDHSRDYLAWDNTEAVRLTSRRKSSAGGDMTDLVPVARRRALTRRELAASRGVYVATDLVWEIPSDQIQALLLDRRQPKPGDLVEPEDGTAEQYTALEVKGQCRDAAGYQTWVLTSRNLALHHDLRDLVDIQRPATSYDRSGTRLKLWPPEGGSTPYRSLPARVQLLTEELADERGIHGFKGTHAVIVGRPVDLTAEDRIKWGSTYLEILGLHNPERIDELPVIDAVLAP